MLLDELTDAHHQLEVRILRGDGENIRVEAIVLAQTLFQILQFRNDKEIIRVPMQQEYLDIAVSCR